MSRKKYSTGKTEAVKHIKLKDGTELIYEGTTDGYWDMLYLLKQMGEI